MRLPQALAAVCLLSGSSSAATDPHHTMPIHVSANGDIVVAVTVEKAGPFRFRLDTGSTRSIVSTDLAARLKLRVIAKAMVVTPSGEILRPLASVSELTVGPVTARTVVAMVTPRDQLGRPAAADGVIGQDVLALRKYTIDYRRREIVWHSGPAGDSGGTRLTLESRGGHVIALLPQATGGQRPLRMIPDTGADSLVFFERAGVPLPPLTPLETARLQTLSGTRPVRRVLIDRLDVGAIRLTDQFGVVVTRAPESPLGDGLLPLHLFARVTFNGPGGYLAIEAF
jgi:predicted aspartyl protease